MEPGGRSRRLVATALQSFLVEEVPAGPPDYELLKPLGADAVVEIVIENYGMRSENGRAGCYVEGYARMFRLDDRSTIWFQKFRRDQVKEKAEHLDPFLVGQRPELFSDRMRPLLDELGAQFAKELTPKDRRGGPVAEEGHRGALRAAGRHEPDREEARGARSRPRTSSPPASCLRPTPSRSRRRRRAARRPRRAQPAPASELRDSARRSSS